MPAVATFTTGVLPPSSPGFPPELLQARDTYRVHGAVIGFVSGGVLTWIALKSGGSTAPCNRSENQDALRPIECAGLVALGGVVGAGIGALIGSAIGRDGSGSSPIERLRMKVGIPYERQGWGLAFEWPVGR